MLTKKALRPHSTFNLKVYYIILGVYKLKTALNGIVSNIYCPALDIALVLAIKGMLAFKIW